MCSGNNNPLLGNIIVNIQAVRRTGHLSTKVKVYMMLLLIILLSGCAHTLGGDLFFNQIDQLEKSLDQSDWSELKFQANKLKDIYEKKKWKLQLLGDEGEYERLNESIQKMIAAIKEEDSINVRLELTISKTLIKDIYSL